MNKKLVETSINCQKKLVDDQIETISFSFQYFSEKKFGLESCNLTDLKELLCQMKNISSKTWNEIRTSHRHGLGSEKIDSKSLRVSIPSECKEKQLLAFRYNGKKPMVGFRRNSVFEILYLDTDFTLYPH